ncbi:MAG: hypothetical protein HY078_03420 [Elusimicrobia bacterium]|nr:hypothetical protein [Elusimicrobiota bacterium]
MKTKVLGLLLAASMLSGCGGFLHNWTAKSDPSDGGILFEANIADENTSGFLLRDLAMFFYKPGEKSSSTQVGLGGYGWGGAIKGFGEHVFLVKLPPGLYSHASLRAGVVGNEVHYISLDQPKGAWHDFKVEPGKVTVMGSLDVNIKLKLVSNNGGSRTFTWEGSNTTWDDRLPARQRVAQVAAGRPEAVSGNWKTAIDYAAQELAAAK